MPTLLELPTLLRLTEPRSFGCGFEKADKTRRRITFEALDSGTPDVANVGNPGDVWLAFLLRGETPRHSWLILSHRALSAFIVLIRLAFVKIFFAFLRCRFVGFRLGRR